MPEFKDFHEVDAEFYKLFLRWTQKKTLAPLKTPQPYLTLKTHKGQDVDVLVRFFKRSGGSDVEDVEVRYPVISIQNFAPTVDPQRNIKTKDWYEGNFYRAEGGELEGSRVFEPIPLDFRYQVSFASQFEHHHNAILQWFYRTFSFYQTEPAFLMNVVPTEQGDLGTVVPYRVTLNDVPREDKFYEGNFEFELKPFVHLRTPETGIPTVGEIDVQGFIDGAQ